MAPQPINVTDKATGLSLEPGDTEGDAAFVRQRTDVAPSSAQAGFPSIDRYLVVDTGSAPLLVASVGFRQADKEKVMRVAKQRSTSNSVLAALPARTYETLRSGLTQVKLSFGDILYEPGQPIRYVYFIDDGLVSLLTLVNAELALEVGMVGREGMLGMPLTLGSSTSPVRALVQGAGSALRIGARRFRKEFASSPILQRELYSYLSALMGQISQTAACNRFHMVGPRLARWLLMTRDRMGSGNFRLTQAFLSHMLGVRRTGVTEAASVLQRRKLIRYSRGNITILDHHGLEEASCSCYKAMNGAHKKKGRKTAVTSRT